MKVAVRYQSRSGNTRKLADAIAEVAGVQAQPISNGLGDAVDILFVGGGVYAGKLEKSLEQFLNRLSPDSVGTVAVFSTSAGAKNIGGHVKDALADGINIAGELDCPGKFLFMNRSRPNEEDLAATGNFAKKMMAMADQDRHATSVSL